MHLQSWRSIPALVLVLTAGAAAPAYAAPPPETHCAVLVSKFQLNDDGSSKVLNESCAPTTVLAVANMLQQAGTARAAASTVLMTWFQHINLTGSTTVIYGDAGTCDSSGYRVHTNNYWEANLSSVRRAGNCNYAEVVTPYPSRYASRCLTMYSMPGGFNDNTAMVNPRYVVGCY